MGRVYEDDRTRRVVKTLGATRNTRGITQNDTLETLVVRPAAVCPPQRSGASVRQAQAVSAWGTRYDKLDVMFDKFIDLSLVCGMIKDLVKHALKCYRLIHFRKCRFCDFITLL